MQTDIIKGKLLKLLQTDYHTISILYPSSRHVLMICRTYTSKFNILSDSPHKFLNFLNFCVNFLKRLFDDLYQIIMSKGVMSGERGGQGIGKSWSIEQPGFTQRNDKNPRGYWKHNPCSVKKHMAWSWHLTALCV